MMSNASTSKTRRLAAILACDIHGYSRVMGADEHQGVLLVEKLTRLVDSAMERFGGRLIKRMGDGVLIEFPSAVTAVECAVTMQHRLAAYNNESDETDRFTVRIGIHLGEIIETANDLLGDGINIAARLEALAPPGGICISEDIRRQLSNQSRFPTFPLGNQPLKNIAQTIEVHRVVTGTEIKSTSAARTTVRPLWRRPGILIPAIIVLIFILLSMNAARRRNDQSRAIQTALAEAKQKYEAGEPQQAVQILEQIQPQLPDHSPLRPLVESAAKKARESVIQRELHTRHMAFIDALLANDAEAVSAFFPPDSTTREDMRQRKPAFRILQGLTGILKLDHNDFRVDRIDLNSDQTHATVYASVRVKDKWNDQKPAIWQKHADAWYLMAR